MALSPLAVSLGLPVAVEAIASGLKLAGQSFHNLLATVQDSAPVAADSNQETTAANSATHRLGDLAVGVRDWLRQHGIRFPYTISVSDQATEVPPVEIEGSERQRIAELLDQNPNLLEQLRDLVRSQATMSPLGFRGKTAIVTESSSHFE